MVKLRMLRPKGAVSCDITLDYIERTFDDYAYRFEATLVGALNYSVPASFAKIVKSIKPGPFRRILDLGCGTGLCSVPFANEGSIIEGVDISSNMLNKCSEKGIYDELHRSEIVAFLNETSNRYDLILCGDVLIYIGAATEVFKGVAKVLTPDGLFAFSIQKLDKDGLILGNDRRFWHSGDYIERELDAAGLKIVKCVETHLRMEEGEGVPGLIFMAGK